MTIIKFAREAARFGRTYKKVDIEVPASRERRQTERAVAYWGEKLDALGDMATIAALDLDKFTSTDWSNRFLIAVDERLEYSMLMMYGTEFARLLGLPVAAQTHLPLDRQLPKHFSDLFLRGCAEVRQQECPVRIEGEFKRDDRRVDQYRSVFIPVKVRPDGPSRFAFGAFNNRISELAVA